MYYKVIYNDKVIDVLDDLIYLKYQTKHGRMVFCDKSEAQAIFSSDRNEIWHVEGLYDIPAAGYDTVRLEEIDKYDYKRLKALNADTSVDGIIDRFVSALVNEEVDQLVESLRRLYISQEIDASKVIEFCKRNKITEEQKKEILGEL